MYRCEKSGKFIDRDNRFILTPQILKFIKTDLSKVMQVVNEK